MFRTQEINKWKRVYGESISRKSILNGINSQQVHSFYFAEMSLTLCNRLNFVSPKGICLGPNPQFLRVGSYRVFKEVMEFQ